MRRRGFSMIELMISLAIIGILATIAIPQFLTYRKRASQSEAKVNLEALRSGEMLYFAETNTYTDDLSLLVWRPDGTPRYLYGFATDARPAPSGRNDTAELAAAGFGEYGTGTMVSYPGVPLVESDLPPGTNAAPTSFLAGAVANLDGDSFLDHMTITENAVLQIVLSDAAVD